MASGFPNLPGFVPNYPIDVKQINIKKQQQWFRRVSSNKQEKNRDTKNVQPTIYPLPRQKQPQEVDQSGMNNPKYMSTTHDTYKPKNLQGEIQDITEQFQPDFVKMDRHTLKFTGFFKESCVETSLESSRIRNVKIYYYLDDNAIEIIEPKQENSGIPQGILLRRQNVLKSNGSGQHLGIDDFRVRGDIEVYGKNIHINDCDVYTREFYENLGKPQELPEVNEQDNWAKKTQTKYVPQKDYFMKDYIEHKLGGGRMNPAKQFLENDRKVLKFFVFSEITYQMHYFLADDTVEIREINYKNSGREYFPMMLRRQKLPRKFALNQPGQVYAEDFVKPQDIRYNDYLDVYGRKFLVQSCDPFTQNYYKEKFNQDFPVGNFEQPMPKDLPQRQIPPYNGFGDEQDSLGYVYRLIPKAPKKDFFKWVDNQVNLRFVVTFNTNKPEDVNRTFVLTYFLNDDTIQIFEPSIRNSGIPDGKFLERKQYKNVSNNNQFFQPTDFVVGRDFVINTISFHIDDCDEFTKKWYSENVEVVN